MSAPRSVLVRFGEFTLDMQSGELYKQDQRIILPDQPFRILAILLRRAGTLVTRDELRRELWAKDTFVDFEHSLNAAIRRLRDILIDSATTPQFIETIPRRGYRFIARVEDVTDTAKRDATRAERPDGQPRAVRRRVAVAALGFVVVSLLAWRTLRDSRGREVSVVARGHLARLTTEGVNVDPALSPDGSLLAYASERAGSGNFDIWMRRIDGGEPMRLTSDAADEVEPAFSPDGESIVFSRREQGGIYVVSTHGGAAKLLMPATRARTPRFSPDGRWVAFWTGQTFKTSPTGLPGPRVPGIINSLMLMPSAGGLARAVAEDFVSARYPIWSPDSGSILFLGEHGEGEESATLDWFVMPIAGGTPRPTGAIDVLARSGVEGIPVPAAWTSGGDVLFTAQTDQAANVWQLAVSPATGRVGGSPKQLTLGTAVERSPSISKDGLLVFDSLVENVDVWRVPLDHVSGIADGALERITDNASTDRVENVSSDGRTMVFVSSRAQRDEVWLKDLHTGLERQLTSSGAVDARISPDGTMVAVSSLMLGEIDLYPVGGGEPSRLCENCGEGAWSMDGTRFIFGRGTPRRRIVIDVRTKVETALAAHPHWNLLQPRFSPGDDWVVFHTTNTPVVRQIYAVPATSGTSVPVESWIPIVTDYGIYPSWAPDGSGIYYFSSRDGFYCAWLQPVDPRTKRPLGEPRPVRHFHEPRLRVAVGTTAMNDVQGGYLYMSLTETTGNIWLMK